MIGRFRLSQLAFLSRRGLSLNIFAVPIFLLAISSLRFLIPLASLSLLTLASPALGESAPTPEQSDSKIRSAPDSRNQIVTFSDEGIDPLTLHTTKSDSIVFFLNSTTDSLTTIEIDYGDRRMHCASSALKLGEDGKIRSVKPFGPRTFTSACFPDRGSYKVTVYGLKGDGAGTSGTIIVE